MKKACGLSERDKDMIRNKSDHVLMRLCQRCQRENVHPPKEVFWEALKEMVWNSGCTERDGHFAYGITHLTSKVEAIYARRPPWSVVLAEEILWLRRALSDSRC